MNKKRDTDSLKQESLYVNAEADANRFNLKCLKILCFFVIIAEVLNEIGLFKAPLVVMRISSALEILILAIPLIVFVIHDKAKKESILNKSIFKHIIITSTYIGIGLMCVALSFHAIILLAIPPLIAAQYRNQKNLFIGVTIATLLLVFVGVYGSFFFGTIDRNFFKGLLTDEELSSLENRYILATSTRMLELLLHYALPRLLGVVAIVFLVSGITRRNGKMLEQQKTLDLKIKEEMEKTTKLQRRVIDSLTTLIETRDIGTGEHVIRTKRYVRIIAEGLCKTEKFKHLTEEDIELFEDAAPLHDVGKIVVSDTILLKPGKLTPEEFEAMKIHTTKGGSVVRDIFDGMDNEDFLRIAEQIAMFHHERWDGTGYPKGLKGEEIPLPARIMAVADVFDALISVRVYKKAVPPEEALNIMMEESGTHFDPYIMDVVDKLREELIQTSMLPLAKIRQ